MGTVVPVSLLCSCLLLWIICSSFSPRIYGVVLKLWLGSLIGIFLTILSFCGFGIYVPYKRAEIIVDKSQNLFYIEGTKYQIYEIFQSSNDSAVIKYVGLDRIKDENSEFTKIN